MFRCSIERYVMSESKTTTKIRFGFRSKNEAALFRIWKEWWQNGEVVYAKSLFSIGGP